ncbi:hypothetical protein A4X13_0g8821, partial [Tilletia indica]
NATPDLAAYIVPTLIHRGQLQDRSGPLKTLNDFLESDDSSFSCSGTAPLFLASRGDQSDLIPEQTQTSKALSAFIGAAWQRAVLRRAGGYAFRHDAGNFFSTAFGLDQARLALDHGLEGDVTRRHYTRDVTTRDVVGLRAEGEPLNSELADSLKAANDIYLRLDSYGVRAMVSRLAAESEDEAIKNPGQKAWKRVAATVTKAGKGGVTEEQRQEVEEDEELVRLVASVREAEEACTSKRDELEIGPMAVTTVLASTDVPTALRTLPRLVKDRCAETTERRARLLRELKRKNQRAENREQLAKPATTVTELKEAGAQVMRTGKRMAALIVKRVTEISARELPKSDLSWGRGLG